MGVICFSSGFSVRGTMDQKLIRKLQDANSECIGVVKGYILGKQHRYYAPRENEIVDKSLLKV